MPHKAFQQRKLLGSERDRLVRSGDTSGQWVKHQIADLQSEIHFGSLASTQRPNAREQLGECKRLSQVIVGAAVQAANLHVNRVARSQQEYRRRHATLSELSANLETIH